MSEKQINSGSSKKTKQMNIRISETQYEMIHEMAIANRMSVSKFIVTACQQYNAKESGRGMSDNIAYACLSERVDEMEKKLTRKFDILLKLINVAIKSGTIDKE